jgi:NitT/TauT family transport system ATP-binding protein
VTDPSAAAPGALVCLDRATLTYPTGVRALDPTDLRVAAGEFVSIIGPSGCGKSTLLRIVAGLLEPTAGTAVRSPDASAAFVFQTPTLMPWANVRRNVRLPMELAGAAPSDAERRVDAALRTVGLAEFDRAFPRELSGGMQMRASLARALVTDPRLLLMDEPFGALDEITRGRLDRELLSVWAARRLSVLFVTHSLYEAVFLSTRVLVMSPRPGRITAELAIDEPHPRADAFRVSERFARLCQGLSALMLANEPAP